MSRARTRKRLFYGMPTTSTTKDQTLGLLYQIQIKMVKMETEWAADKAEFAICKAGLEDCKVGLEASKAELATCKAELATCKAELARKDELIARLKLTNEKFSRMIFGAKSERFVDPIPDHPALTGFEEILKSAEPTPAATTTVPAHQRRAHRNQKGRMELPANLRREEKIIDVPDCQKIDPVTGEPLKLIGYEESERLGYRSGWFVLVIKRAKYANPERPLSGVVTAPTPPCAIEKSLFDDSFLAWLLVSKGADHLPIDRITKILKRSGLDFDRSTLNGQFHQGARVLEPLYNAMVDELVASHYVHSDDTKVRMQRPGGGKSITAIFWGVVAGIGPPLTVYEFTNSREGKWPSLFFENFKGFLHADDYVGYNPLFDKRDEQGQAVVIHIACWAHARRKYEECLKPVPYPEAQAMLALIRKLYGIERQAKELTPEERRLIRQEQSRPIVDAIFALALDIRKKESPQSPLAKAATYMLGLKEQLSLFLEHPFLGLDNNPVENAHRPIAVGRKNWLNVGNEECGQNLAVVMSLITTCTKLGINPQEYLTDILPRIQDHPANKVRDLLPDRWLAARQSAATATDAATVKP